MDHIEKIAQLEAEVAKYKTLYETCLKSTNTLTGICYDYFMRVKALEAEAKGEPQREEYSHLRIVR